MKYEWGYDTLEQKPLLGSAISIFLLPLRSASPTQGLDLYFWFQNEERMKQNYRRPLVNLDCLKLLAVLQSLVTAA